MWPGLDSPCGRHTWVEFVVGSYPCFEGFSPFTKANIPEFQFDLETVEEKAIPWQPLCYFETKRDNILVYVLEGVVVFEFWSFFV